MRYPRFIPVGLLICSFVFGHAQIPVAEQLLPEDTIGVVTLPDWKKVSAFYEGSSWGQLWADPAVKPFKEKFTTKFKAEFTAPLEKELGLKLADYKELLQGQITLALTPPRDGTDHFFGFLLLVDAKDKTNALVAKITDLKKKWTDSGKQMRTEKIRDIEFSVVTFTRDELNALLEKVFPGDPSDEKETDAADKAEKTELYLGQFKSLFIAGENPKAIEKMLARQGGGTVVPLAEQPSFQKSHAMLFRDALGYAWVNFKPIYQHILKLAGKEQEAPPAGMPQFNLEKILPAIGISSLDSIALKLGGNAEGSVFEALLGIPEAQRQGIFKIFKLEAKDASPPAFVPADVIKFQRVRLDARKAWEGLQAMVTKIDPSLAGMFQFMLGAVEEAGKQQDPNFSFNKNFIGNLGDDFITYEKAPKVAKASPMQTPPSLILIGTANAPQLVEALRVVTMLGPVTGPPVEREFLGKKIYSLTMAIPAAALEAEGDDAKAPPPQTLSFAASSGYVALSTDNAVLEEYLRSADSPAKPLRELPGLAEASQKTGGMEKGLFTYENQAESTRILFEMLKSDPDALQRNPFLQVARGGNENGGGFSDWFDVKLLPSFDRISKYFGIAVVNGADTADGIVIRAYSPTPPGLRK